jgi:translin
LTDLNTIAEKIRQDFTAKNAARDAALARSRELVRYSANAIRAVHRADFDEVSELLQTAEDIVAQLKRDLAAHPDIYHAGYTQDALKEFTEASLTLALVKGDPLPSPADLGVEDAAYLNGLGEAAAELRRHALDLIRQGRVQRAEEILAAMEEVYSVLVTMDFPEAITSGLRRTTDMVRGVVERTRGDVTIAFRQQQLEKALQNFEGRILPR